MTCERFTTRDGPSGFICYPGSRSARCSVAGCSNRATKLCDFPLKGAKAGATCSRALCIYHAVKQTVATLDPDESVDFCPTHAAATKAAAR